MSTITRQVLPENEREMEIKARGLSAHHNPTPVGKLNKTRAKVLFIFFSYISHFQYTPIFPKSIKKADRKKLTVIN